MSCIIIGAGISGLSIAYFLKKNGMDVKVYSSKNKRAASGIFTGILYRYPGRWGKKSKFADEAYEASMALINKVEEKTKREVIVSKGVIKKFAPRLKKYADVMMKDQDAYIEDAVTVDMQQYLEGLRELIGKEHFEEREVNDLKEIEGLKIVASGYGVKDLLNLDNLMYRKGQQYKGKKKIENPGYGSIVGRGHISFLGDDRICLGSTYETDFTSEEVDKDYAVREIRKKMEPWTESLEDVRDKEFVSGVRVGQDTTYLPLIKKIDCETYVFTGLGSRGLLYHAYYGKILSNQVCSKELWETH